MRTVRARRRGWIWRLSVAGVVLVAGYGLGAARGGPALSDTGAPPAAAARSLSAPGGAAVQPRSLTVTTDAGQVLGRRTALVDQFLGMPYAAPPVGALRWEPPQPVTPWTGIRSALSYGSRCAQLPSTNGPRFDTEDCLTINVYAPAVIPVQEKLPVLFMINGGELENGAGDQHDGSLLAQDDRIVVVSFNYRLGPFGFLTLPGLTASSVGANGNFGLLDMEAALSWVKRNIAAFGGDPGAVAIAGESAGAGSVCALLASPPAAGLFSRAIMESGSCTSESAATAQANSLSFAAQANCTVAATAASCLRATSEATLLDASSGYMPQFVSGGPELPIPPAQAIASGRFTKVPILLGTNRDEARPLAAAAANWTQQQYVQFVTSTFGTALTSAVLKAYPLTSFAQPYAVAYALAAELTDSGVIEGIGGCSEQNLAQQFVSDGIPTFFYEFDDRNAPPLSKNIPPGYQEGAGHAMELAYMWPSFDNGFPLYPELTGAQLQLSRQMIAYWGSFVRYGSPWAAFQPPWLSYGSQLLMSLRPGDQSHEIPAATFATEHDCGFWNTVGRSAEGVPAAGTARLPAHISARARWLLTSVGE
jgi:carboxylesterase type B